MANATINGIEISAAEIYKTADPTYANCLICSVNPTGRCEICDDRTCPHHTYRVLEKRCPLCYATELVYHRKRIINVVANAAILKAASTQLI